MRETTRARYEQLRRQRKRLNWRSIHQRRLFLGSGLLAIGIVLLALSLRGVPLASQPPEPSPVSGEGASSTILQATVVPVGGAEPVPQTPVVSLTAAESPGVLYSSWRLTSEPGFTAESIQKMLDGFPGVLKGLELDIGDRRHSFAEVLVGQAALYGVNPKIVLAMMEMQQGLLSDPDPDAEQLAWALGYQGNDGNMRGLAAQVRWAVRELRRGVRDYPSATELVFADDSRAPLPADLDIASYAVMRTLARTSSAELLPALMNDFIETYSRLFEDPRQPLDVDLPPPAEPFLTYPLDRLSYVTSFFDHEYPFLVQNGSLVSYWDRRETAISYDGHDGWDYGARPPTGVLAAAPGTVLFAGNSDDGCGQPARGVIIDHGNGYRTLYWHLSQIDVTTGEQVDRGQLIGIVGATGCATGPHLHFQVHYLGRSTDPFGWCGDGATDPWAVHPIGIGSRWLWQDRPNPCSPPTNVLVVAATGEGFVTTGDWESAPVGVHGGSLWTKSLPPLTATLELSATGELSDTPVLSDTQSPLSGLAVETEAFEQQKASATWYPALAAGGRYRVLAYVPYFYNGLADARQVRYEIGHADGTSEVRIDQHTIANDWADLGTYSFEPGRDAWVRLTNETDGIDEAVWAGAMMWVPVDR